MIGEAGVAGDGGHQGAQDADEASEEHGPASPSSQVGASPVPPLPPHPLADEAVVDAVPEVAADLVADGVADDGARDGARHRHSKVEVAPPAQEPGQQHDRLARDEQAREGGRLGGGGDEDEDVAPRVEAPAQGVHEAVGPRGRAQHRAETTGWRS